jgi:hypothetical protein
VTADPDNTIPESIETNNGIDVVITIDATGGISVGACVLNPDFSHVYVTFSEAWVYNAGTWTNIPMTEKTVDLVYLHESSMTELLGVAGLESGEYTKVKLIIDNASAISSETGELVNLSLPSNEFVVDYQFGVNDNGFVNVIVYFDLIKSIKQNDGTYEFVPTLLRVVEEKHSFETSLEPTSLELYTGQVGTHTVTITNTGTVNDVYSLTLISGIDENWIDFPSTLEVPAGESRTALLKFTAPENLILNKDVTYPFQVVVNISFSQTSVLAFTPSLAVDGSLTVKAKIPATVDIDPDTLNLKSNGRWITAYIELPSGYDLASVNIGTITLENVAPAESRPTAIGDHDNDGIPDLMVKFDRSAVQALVSVGDVKLTVAGKWHTVLFSGSDSIRVINPGQGQGSENKPSVSPGQSDNHPGCGNQGDQQGQNGQGSVGNQGNSQDHEQSQSNPGHDGQPPGQSSNNGQGNSSDQASDNQSPVETPQEQGESQNPGVRDNQAQGGQDNQTPSGQGDQSPGQGDQGNQGQGDSNNQSSQGQGNSGGDQSQGNQGNGQGNQDQGNQGNSEGNGQGNGNSGNQGQEKAKGN